MVLVTEVAAGACRRLSRPLVTAPSAGVGNVCVIGDLPCGVDLGDNAYDDKSLSKRICTISRQQWKGQR